MSGFYSSDSDNLIELFLAHLVYFFFGINRIVFRQLAQCVHLKRFDVFYLALNIVFFEKVGYRLFRRLLYLFEVFGVCGNGNGYRIFVRFDVTFDDVTRLGRYFDDNFHRLVRLFAYYCFAGKNNTAVVVESGRRNDLVFTVEHQLDAGVDIHRHSRIFFFAGTGSKT